jgi:hypothetical protein
MSKIGRFDTVLSDAGRPTQATITVYNAGTLVLATIYSDAAGVNVLANPFITDALGRFQFFASVGNYDIQVSGSGITTYKIENQPVGYAGMVTAGMVIDARDYASFAAAITAIGATKCTLVISTSLAVAADVTIPVTCHLKFERGGELVVATTKTVTLTSEPDAGLFRIFNGTGTGRVIFSWNTPGIRQIYPEWWGALADGSHNDQPAIQAAIIACPAGGTIYLSAGGYYATGSGTELFLVQNHINIIGSDARGTFIVPGNAVANTVDVFRLATWATEVMNFSRFSNFTITPETPGACGRHGINIDMGGGSFSVFNLIFDGLQIDAMAGNGIITTGTGAIASSVIQNSKISNGLRLVNAGDSLRIIRNTLTGQNEGIYADMQVGANCLEIIGNNITHAKEAIYINNAQGPIYIERNNIEQGAPNVGSLKSMLTLKGATAAVRNCSIKNNSFGMLGGMNLLYGIYLDTANHTVIEGNEFGLAEPATMKAVYVSANAAHTYIGENYNRTGAIDFLGIVTDAGTYTNYFNPGGIKINPNSFIGRAGAVTINDDSVLSFIPQNQVGMMAFNDYAAAHAAILAFNTLIPRMEAVVAQSYIHVTTGILTGTTGTDGFITISCHAADEKIYIENRIGGPITPSFILMAGLY